MLLAASLKLANVKPMTRLEIVAKYLSTLEPEEYRPAVETPPSRNTETETSISHRRPSCSPLPASTSSFPSSSTKSYPSQATANNYKECSKLSESLQFRPSSTLFRNKNVYDDNCNCGIDSSEENVSRTTVIDGSFSPRELMQKVDVKKIPPQALYLFETQMYHCKKHGFVQEMDHRQFINLILKSQGK